MKHIVVLGHATCGGIKAFANKATPLSKGNFIGKWVSLVEPAEAKAAIRRTGLPDPPGARDGEPEYREPDDLPLHPGAGEGGQHDDLHGAHFGVATGELKIPSDPATGDFVPASWTGAAPGAGGPSALIDCT